MNDFPWKLKGLGGKTNFTFISNFIIPSFCSSHLPSFSSHLPPPSSLFPPPSSLLFCLPSPFPLI